MVSAALPFIGVIVAVLSFGSYSLPLKGEAVQAAQLHPVIFQLYVSLGVSLSSLLLLIAAPEAATSDGFPPEGIASAFIWNLGNTASSGAVMFSGLAVAQGLWAPMIAFTSFIWDVAAFKEKPGNLGLTILGLLIMSLGCVILAYVGGRANATDEGSADGAPRMSSQLVAGSVGLMRTSRLSGAEPRKRFSNDLDVPLMDMEFGSGRRQEKGQANKSQFWLGIALTVVVGLFAGSLFVPLMLAPAHVRDGLNTCKSSTSQGFGSFSWCCAVRFAFAQGVTTFPCYALQAPLLLGLIHVYQNDGRRFTWPPLHHETCLGPGMMAGCIWNVGNAASILATLPPLTTVGYSLTQAAMLVACLWGVVVFKVGSCVVLSVVHSAHSVFVASYLKEITGKDNIRLFALGAIVTFGGLIITAVFGAS